MSTILCSYSGIEYHCDHFSALNLSGRESHHPIFDTPIQRLLTETPRWLNQELSPVENYMLYLALFNSTGLMEFRSPAIRTGNTATLVATHMHRLAAIVERIHNSGETTVTELLHLPKFVISPDTKDLEASGDWISIWENCYTDYLTHYKTSTALEKLTRKETILERYIKDRNKDITSYAPQLAEWAADAGNFPVFAAGLDKSILGGREMSLRDYWKHIIRACTRTESIWDIPDADIIELIEHCEDCIEHGSIYSHTLMTLLREGLSRKRNFFNLGDMDIGSRGPDASTFRILDADASIEDANKLALIDSAPATEPVESHYPNKLAYLKAKLNYKMKVEYDAGLAEIRAANNESVTSTNASAETIATASAVTAHMEQASKITASLSALQALKEKYNVTSN